MIRPAAEVFAEELDMYKEGHALWKPSLAEFGDVGYISSDGKFKCCFNLDGTAYYDPNDPELPVTFVPEEEVVVGNLEKVRLPLEVFYHHMIDRKPGFLLSKRMRLEEGRFKLRCVGPRGAYCYFTQHSSTYGCSASQQLRNYVKENHRHWVEYLAAENNPVDPDQLVFVRGTVKTATWLFNTIQQNSSTTLDMTVTHTVEYDRYKYQLLGISPERHVDTHMGPPGDSFIPPVAVRDMPPLDLEFKYCYFLSYYRVKTRAFLGPHIVASAEPHSQSEDRDEGPSSSQSISSGKVTMDMVQIHKPLEALLDYILEFSEAKAAIACHEDIDELCQEEYPHDLAAFLRETRPPVYVDADQYGSLDLEAIHKDRDNRGVTTSVTAQSSEVVPSLSLSVLSQGKSEHESTARPTVSLRSTEPCRDKEPRFLFASSAIHVH